MVVDSERIKRLGESGKRLFHPGRLRSAKVWLGILLAANIAYVGVGFTSQRASGDPPAQRPTPDMPVLRLVSEMTAAQAAAPAERLVCHSWGPFSNADDFVETQARIEAAGGSSRVRQSVVFADPDYLVYVGRRGEAENARRTLEELKSQSIESGLIVRGPFTNTLSVGVFSRADRAQLQQERVAKLGYEVGIEEIGRSYDVFHLEGQVPAGFDPGNAPNGPCASIAQAH